MPRVSIEAVRDVLLPLLLTRDLSRIVIDYFHTNQGVYFLTQMGDRGIAWRLLHFSERAMEIRPIGDILPLQDANPILLSWKERLFVVSCFRDKTLLYKIERGDNPPTQLANAVEVRQHNPVGVVVSDTLYLFGGSNEKLLQSSRMERYDFLTGKWEHMQKPVKDVDTECLRHCRAAVSDSVRFIYIVGFARDCWRYDTQSGVFKRLESSHGWIPGHRHFSLLTETSPSSLSSVATLYFSGGYYSSGGEDLSGGRKPTLVSFSECLRLPIVDDNVPRRWEECLQPAEILPFTRGVSTFVQSDGHVYALESCLTADVDDERLVTNCSTVSLTSRAWPPSPSHPTRTFSFDPPLSTISSRLAFCPRWVTVL